MRAVRKDYFLDHDHSVYVDQWDWERPSLRPAQSRFPESDRQQNLDSACRRGTFYLEPVFRTERSSFSATAREAHFPSCRRSPRDVSRPAAQTAGDHDSPEISRSIHHRHRLDFEGRLSARNASRGLRRLDHGNRLRRWQDDARSERRHPGLEPDHQAAARTVVDGNPSRSDDAASSS